MSGFAVISYARDDRDYVRRLAKFLADEGIEVWHDDAADFDTVMKKKIDESAAVVVLSTPAARRSPWVVDELEYAKDRCKEIVVIRFGGDLLLGLGGSPAEMLTDEEMPSPRFVKALRGLVGGNAPLREIGAHDGFVTCVAFPARESSLVASAGTRGGVRLWNPTTGEARLDLPDAEGPVSFSHYGETIATAGPEYSACLWDTATGELIKKVGEHPARLDAVALSADDGTLVTSAGGKERIWSVVTGEQLGTVAGRIRPASPVVLSPDGMWLAAPTAQGTKRGAGLWSVPGGGLIGTLDHPGQVHDVTISWDGRYVATGGADTTARIWDARTGALLFTLAAHAAPVRAVAFSPGGYRLATGSSDQTIRLWDATTGAQVTRVAAGVGGIYDLAYSPDGSTLASGHGDGTLRLWTT